MYAALAFTLTLVYGSCTVKNGIRSCVATEVYRRSPVSSLSRSMNLRRYERGLKGPPNLGSIAGHLDVPSLQTVTAREGSERRTTIETAPDDVHPLDPSWHSALFQLPSAVCREILQKWPAAAKTAYETAGIKHALVVSDMGPHGAVCISTDRQLHVWTVANDDAFSHYKSTMPVDADILAMECIQTRSTLSASFGPYLLVLAYEREVGQTHDCPFTLLTAMLGSPHETAFSCRRLDELDITCLFFHD